MKYLLGTFFLLLMTFSYSNAQHHSEYDMVKSDQEGELIYKGTCTFTDIGAIEAFHLYTAAKAYKPEKKAMDMLVPQLGAYKIVLLLGTWCEDSHMLVPQLYAVLREAKYPVEHVLIYALDRDKKGKNKEEEIYQVTQVPTIILLKNGEEKGRITETVKNSIEQDLLDIITQEQE